jgi:hypothetical protein
VRRQANLEPRAERRRHRGQALLRPAQGRIRLHGVPGEELQEDDGRKPRRGEEIEVAEVVRHVPDGRRAPLLQEGDGRDRRRAHVRVAEAPAARDDALDPGDEARAERHAAREVRQLKVTVSVDEPGKEDAGAQVAQWPAWRSRIVRPADPRHAPGVHRDPPVAERRPRDGQHPGRGQDLHGR